MMRIVSWNVNGLYTTLKDATHRFSNASIYFTTILHADIVCFQEAKIQEEKLEKWMACVPGFESFWAFSQAKKGYSGVVTYVKDSLSPLDAAAEKLPGDEDLCREGRIVETDHGSFVLVNVYVPNAGDRQEGRPRLEFKVRLLQALKQKCDELVSSGRHVVVVGDFNIAHKRIDVHKKWNVEEIYSSEEKAWLDNFLTEYVDLFRHFHPDVNDIFSVWEAKTDARIHNEGLRIDYAVCDKGFLSQVKDTQILKMVPKNWSDHAAVVLTLQDQPALPPHPPASISSRNMKRFQEDVRQKKLTSLFSRGASKPMSPSVAGTDSKPGHSEQGNAIGSSPVSQDPEAETFSTAGLDNFDQCTAEDQGISPRNKSPVPSETRSAATHDSNSVKGCGETANGDNGNTGGAHLIGASAQHLDRFLEKVNQQEMGNSKQTASDSKHADGEASNCGAMGDVLDSKANSKDKVQLIASGLEAQPDVTSVESGKSSPLKRKHSDPLTRITVAPAKQRNLTSYFKVNTDGSGASEDDLCKN